MIGKVKIPPGWEFVRLADISKIGAGNPAPQGKEKFDTNGVPFVRVKDMGKLAGQKFLRNSADRVNEIGSANLRLFPKGTVLLTKSGASTLLNQRAVLGEDSYVVSHIATVSAGAATSADWLYYFLRTIDASTLAHGGNMPSLPLRRIGQIATPLPPLNEQRRIVEKIETLFARLDKGEEALRQVQKLLARYRQSVLKAAVTGQLTADWRTKNAHRLEHGRDLLARILQTRRETWQGRGKYKEPAAPDTTDLPELPEGWVWASMEQLANVIGGLTKNKKRQEMPLRRPMVRVANVYQNRLELDEIQEIGVTDTECARVLLEDLDLLVVEGNGSKDQIGRMAIWRKEIPDAVHQNHLIKVRMTEKGLVEHALWWFQSPSGRRNIEKVASSTSGLYTLSIRKIEALIVPVPSLQEVSEINRLVDEAFSKIAQLESWCATELSRSVALRQSILKDAFAGRLVPQDPGDEPAADLLARIKETRDTAPQKPRKKAITI